MADGLSVDVGGPSAIFPRHYLWVAPVWYLVVAAPLLLSTSTWMPPWFRIGAAAGLLGAMLTLIAALALIQVRACTVDSTGVWLGLPPTSRRRGRDRRRVVFLPWAQIERLRLRDGPFGVRLDFLLSPAAPTSVRPIRYDKAEALWRWLVLLIPGWYLKRPIGVATPLDGPPRYRMHARGRTLDQLRREFRAAAPSEVTVAVVVRKGTAVSSPTTAPPRTA
jgi:hypothetical protein